MKFLLLFCFLVLGKLAFSQDTTLVDTISKNQLENEVEVSFNRFKFSKLSTFLVNYELNRALILRRQPEDLGELLLIVPSLRIKSYGGLGGLKTLSSRSSGAAHTVVLQDGFSKSNVQSGGINLGALQTDNIESVTFSSSGITDNLINISAMAAGSVLSFQTFEASMPVAKSDFRATIKYGSFDQYDAFVAYKKKIKQHFLGAMIKYRQADGDYNYRLQNGYLDISDIRKNNDYRDAYAGLSWGINKTNWSTLLTIRSQKSDQGLPSAVILYNNSAGQRLKNENHELNFSFNKKFKRQSLRIYTKGSFDQTVYIDNEYLNSAGFLINEYENYFAQLGVSAYASIKNLNITYGDEVQVATLISENIQNDSVDRIHNFAHLGFSIKQKRLEYALKFNSQYVIENKQLESRESKLTINPQASIGIHNFLFKNTDFLIWYQNSLRMPTFNELYYHQIGNKDLQPERLNQLSIAYAFNQGSERKNELPIDFRFNAYYNQIEDQILAIPSKNLFIWSIQNIGRTETIGADITLNHTKRFKNKHLFINSLSGTYQNTMDVSDSSSPTYRHQIAYIPKWSGSYQFAYSSDRYGLNITFYANSLRYSLNQNVDENLLPAFFTLDVSVFRKWKIKDNNLRLQATIKNATNTSYAYVKYYVMPGINYIISLSYALH